MAENSVTVSSEAGPSSVGISGGADTGGGGFNIDLGPGGVGPLFAAPGVEVTPAHDGSLFEMDIEAG
jgi:hypothetical protein